MTALFLSNPSEVNLIFRSTLLFWFASDLFWIVPTSVVSCPRFVPFLDSSISARVRKVGHQVTEFFSKDSGFSAIRFNNYDWLALTLQMSWLFYFCSASPSFEVVISTHLFKTWESNSSLVLLDFGSFRFSVDFSNDLTSWVALPSRRSSQILTFEELHFSHKILWDYLRLKRSLALECFIVDSTGISNQIFPSINTCFWQFHPWSFHSRFLAVGYFVICWHFPCFGVCVWDHYFL